MMAKNPKSNETGKKETLMFQGEPSLCPTAWAFTLLYKKDPDSAITLAIEDTFELMPEIRGKA
jgi:hypothetical protein